MRTSKTGRTHFSSSFECQYESALAHVNTTRTTDGIERTENARETRDGIGPVETQTQINDALEPKQWSPETGVAVAVYT